MENDKIKININILGKPQDLTLKSFINNFSKSNFIFGDNFSKKNILIIAPEDSKKNQIIKIVNKYKKENYKKIVLLIHQSNENILFNEVKTIYYPIDIQEVQKQFKKNYSHEYYYKNILLLNNDILKSKKSKKMVNLTEIEATVLRLLINKKKIDKEKLNFLALSQKKGVESKSLESHLSRLRKKISLIDKDIKIFSDKGSIIKLI